jgi:hypothetical protein
MRIIEFRVFVPLRVEQCDISCCYISFKRSAEAKGESSSEGLEYLESTNYENEKESGRFTHKVLHLKSRVPAIIRWVIPDKYLHIHERSYNAFPHYLTEYEMPGMGEDFILSTDTHHFEYKLGDKIPENSSDLNEEELKIRKISYLDILNGPVEDEELLINGFSYPPCGINELKCDEKPDDSKPPGWLKNYKGPITLIIKTVKFHFKWTGVQTAVEAFVMNSVMPSTFMDNHRAMVKWAPEWEKLTLDDVTRMEQEKQEEDKKKEFN